MNLLQGVLNQTATYWPPSTGIDDYGQPILEAGVELMCRWEDTQEEFVAPNGEKEISRARVFLEQDVVVGGLLYLGGLDVTGASDFPANPRDAGAMEIRSFQKTPDFDAVEFIRMVIV